MESLTAFCSNSVLRGGAILSCGLRRAIATAIANTVPDADCVSQMRALSAGLPISGCSAVYQREYDLRSAQMLEESANQNLPGISGTSNVRPTVEAQFGRTAFRELNMCAGQLAGEGPSCLC